MISNQQKRQGIPGVGRVIGVLGGKGGTGKSFLSVNLAALLAKSGKKVGIFDADFYCPAIFHLLGIVSKLPQAGDGKLSPIEKYGIKAMSIAGLCKSHDEPIAYRGMIISKILQQLFRETVWGELDILIVDFPPGTGDITLNLLSQYPIDCALLVSTPDPLASLATRRTIGVTNMFKIPTLGIVENMRGEIYGEGGVSEIARNFSLPFIGSIPMRKQIAALSASGIPAVFQVEELELILSKIARIVMELPPVHASVLL